MAMSGLLYLAAVCSCLLLPALAYPTGAGWNACENTMTPLHSNDSKTPIAQKTKSPYNVFVKADQYKQDYIEGGEEVEVILSGPDHFKGFILAAVSEDNGEEILVGEFREDQSDKGLNLTQNMCAGTAVTHTIDWNLSTRKSISLFWKAPKYVFTGRVWFFATFVKNFDTFWVNVLGDQEVSMARALPANFIPMQEDQEIQETTTFGETLPTRSTATSPRLRSTSSTISTSSTAGPPTAGSPNAGSPPAGSPTAGSTTISPIDSTTASATDPTASTASSTSSTSSSTNGPSTTAEKSEGAAEQKPEQTKHQATATLVDRGVEMKTATTKIVLPPVIVNGCEVTNIQCLKSKAVFGIHNLIMTLEKIRNFVSPKTDGTTSPSRR